MVSPRSAGGQHKPAGADRRVARFQQRPGGKPSVATVTELRRKSLCIVTKATTVDRWGRREGGEGWTDGERGDLARRGGREKERKGRDGAGEGESKNNRME